MCDTNSISWRFATSDDSDIESLLVAFRHNHEGRRVVYLATFKAGTNSEFEFVPYLRPGDHVHLTSELESISNRKTTSLGKGYFLTWVTTYTSGTEEIVGRQLFRIFKFDPSTIGATS